MIQVNKDRRILYKGSEKVKLTKTEFSLLMVFYTMGHRVLDMDFLIDAVTGNRVKIPQDKNIIMNLISRLRSKIDPELIETRKGKGYLLAKEIQLTGRYE